MGELEQHAGVCPDSHSIVGAMAGANARIDCCAWWGSINEVRAACQGSRLADDQVEHNWGAACVYRAPDGSLHGFVGANERENGITTTYKFVCTNEDVTYSPDGDMENGQFRKRGKTIRKVIVVPGRLVHIALSIIQ